MRPSPSNRSWPEADTRIEVSIQKQSLTLFKKNEAVFTSSVSTATNGIGFEEGSYCTPTGEFVIRERIGEGSPLCTNFKARRPIGIWRDDRDEDFVLTRILWLEGLEAGNANTYQRYIYFHGTNEEKKIGAPASHGCIRLKNTEMLQLFNLTPLFSRVRIF